MIKASTIKSENDLTFYQLFFDGQKQIFLLKH